MLGNILSGFQVVCRAEGPTHFSGTYSAIRKRRSNRFDRGRARLYIDSSELMAIGTTLAAIIARMAAIAFSFTSIRDSLCSI